MDMNINELTMAILDWEKEAQEDFTDYYMHDCVDWSDWADWLEKQGFLDRAEAIKFQIEKGECVCQDLLFRINGCVPYCRENGAEEVWTWGQGEEEWLELYRKDVFLWAQFMCEDEERLAHITNWLDKYPETWL